MRFWKRKKKSQNNSEKPESDSLQTEMENNDSSKFIDEKGQNTQTLIYSPYLNQLHLYFEKSLLEDDEMDGAHHLSHFLLKNPEFYPEDIKSKISLNKIKNHTKEFKGKTKKI